MPFTTAPLNRRHTLGALAAGAAWLAAPAWAQDSSAIRLGQSTALTGPLADLGQATHQGAKAAFEAINAKGGIHGRSIELVVQDDGYDAKKALANVTALAADTSIFALFNCFGTPAIEAMLPLVTETGIPLFAPYTGAQVARPAALRQVMNIRASYMDEAERLVEHLATVGIKRLGLAYQNNTFGKEVFEAVKKAMERHGLKDLAVATVESSAEDVPAAATKIGAGNPEAVLLGLAGKPGIEMIKLLRKQRKGMPLYALSVLASSSTLKALGPDGIGLAVTQVVPLPTHQVLPVVRDYLAAWKASGTELQASHMGLEGYINARVFAEGLQRAGKNPSRASFIDAVWKIRRLDLGGFELGFGQPGSNASRFVELTMVGRDGRFVR